MALVKQSQKISEWEKNYIHALVEELKPHGDVLLIGFNDGEAAKQILSKNPTSLTIIEADASSATKANEWAEKHKNVKVINQDWRKALHHLDAFDTVLFDERTHASSMELIQRLSPDVAQNIANSSKDILGAVKEKFASIKKKFSNEEMTLFYDQLGQHHLSELVPFLKNLKDNGNITHEQFESLMKKIHQKNAKSSQKESSSHEETLFEEKDALLLFVESAFKKHLKKGSRLTAFLSNNRSKYEDPLFFDRIASNEALSYSEKVAKIQVPEINVQEALVILIHKH